MLMLTTPLKGEEGTLGSTRFAGESGGPPETMKACGSPTVKAACAVEATAKLPTPTARAIGATMLSLILFSPVIRLVTATVSE
jgi:hypothetical protein